MKTSTILKIASSIISTLSTTACDNANNANLTALPLVNSISAVKNKTATPIPLSGESIFVVNGRISHTVYLFGEGMVILEDIETPTNKLYIIAKVKHKKGEIVTINIKKKEMLNIDEATYSVYIEK